MLSVSANQFPKRHDVHRAYPNAFAVRIAATCGKQITTPATAPAETATPAPAETQTITLGLSACCGRGQNVTRELTREQYDTLAKLADELNKSDGESSYFTVPFFYISDWQ